MIAWIKRNWILLLKIATVVLYFIFAGYQMICYGVFPNVETLDEREIFVEGIVG